MLDDYVYIPGQVEVYFGCGGLELNAPKRRREMVGCCPIGTPSTLSWVEEIAERYELSEYPCSNRLARKLATSLTGPQTGSASLSLHQLTHLPNMYSYALVDLSLQDASKSFAAGSEILSFSYCCWRQATRLTLGPFPV